MSSRAATELRVHAIACPGSNDYPQFAWVSLWTCVSFVCVLFLSLLCGWGAVEKRETEEANMSKPCYRRRSKMKRRGVENRSNNAPKSIKHVSKMAPWRPLGGPWAPTLLPEPSWSRPGEALGRPGASQKLLLAALGRPWSEKLIDFTLPEDPREGPGEVLGGHFGSIFAVGPGGTKNKKM